MLEGRLVPVMESKKEISVVQTVDIEREGSLSGGDFMALGARSRVGLDYGLVSWPGDSRCGLFRGRHFALTKCEAVLAIYRSFEIIGFQRREYFA